MDLQINIDFMKPDAAELFIDELEYLLEKYNFRKFTFNSYMDEDSRFHWGIRFLPKEGEL